MFRNGDGPATSTASREVGGSGTDLDDCKAKFKIAWAQIRAGLTDADVAKAHEMGR